jgi:hypothetical protein
VLREAVFSCAFSEQAVKSRCLAAAVDGSNIGVGWMISWQSPMTLIATLSVCRGFVAMVEMVVRPHTVVAGQHGSSHDE